MKRFFILIACALLLATAGFAVAAEKPTPFNPKIHSETNLPEGILYVDNGTVYLIATQRVVVNDAEYPFSSKLQVYTLDGQKITKERLKPGQEVDVFANDRHEAVYIVVK